MKFYKKIFIDALALTSYETGVSVYTFNTLTRLIKLDNKIFYTILLPTDTIPIQQLKSLKRINTQLIHRNLSALGPKRDIFYLFNSLFLKKYDEFFCFSAYLPLFNLPCKSTITIHDLKYYSNKNFIGSIFKSLYIKISFKNSFRQADKINTVSKFTQKQLIINKVKKNKISIVPNAGTFKENIYKNNNFIKNKKFILCVATNRPHKNLKKLIESYKLFCNKVLNAPKLVIIGSNTNELAYLVKKLNLNNRVLLKGYLEKNQLIRYYENSLIFILVSLYEGFGIPILDAMKFKIPTITSNISATRELGYKCSIQVNPHNIVSISNALYKLNNSKSLRISLTKKAFQKSKLFCWDNSAKILYEQIR